MKKNAVQITDFSSKNIPVLNRQLKDIWNNLGKADYEEVTSSSTAPTGGSHGDLKILNDGTNKVLWINIEGSWSNIGSLISSLIDHTHSSTSGEGGQLDWDSCWTDAIHTHQSNGEGATLDHGAALTGLGDDDHTQYHNDTRGDARYYTETELNAGQLDNRYFTETEHLATSAGATDASKPIKLDADGNIDATMINDADVSHSGLTGTHNLTTDIDHDSITNTHSKNIFKTIVVSGQDNVVADDDEDTLTLVAGSNVTLTTNATTDSITIAASGSGFGSMNAVKETGVQIGDADIATLDFDGTDFNLSESPDTEINISIEDSGIDHGAVTGLSDDDHAQYLLADATRKVNGSLSPNIDNTHNLGIVGVTDYRWKDLKLSGNLDDETNQISVAQCKTAYDHSQDNTQAHSDYLLNSGADETSGRLTAAGLTTSQNLIIGSNWVTNDGDNEGIQVGVTGFVGINTVPTYNLDIDGSTQTVLRLKGDGDTFAYATLYLMSDEVTDKTWALGHRQDIANNFVLQYHNGADWATAILVDTALLVNFGAGIKVGGNVQLNSKWLSNDGGNEGIRVSDGGLVGVNRVPTVKNLEVDGSCYFGDVTNSHTTEIESDGTIKFNGNATIFGIISIPVSSMVLSISSPPALTGYKAGYSLGFDSASDEVVSFRVEIPPDYKEGTNITVYIHWTPTDNGAGNVVWSLDYSWANVDSAFPSATTVNITVAADEVTDKHQRDEFFALTGTGKTIGSVILCSIKRDGDNASDTYASDALLHSLSIHYEKDTIGSRTIITK
jgi:hypothetical protein